MAAGSVIIIGGGIAGLSSAIYAAANGYETTVLEMHTLPGGLCTSWEREGYTFDGCIHWFVGGKPGSGFRPLWEEVGATDGLGLVAHDRLSTVRDTSGEELTFWADLDRFGRDGLSKWPSETRGFKEIVDGARVMVKAGSSVPSVPPDMMGAFDGLKMLVRSGSDPSGRCASTTRPPWKIFSAHFSNPFLRRAVLDAIIEPRMSAMAFLGTLGWFEAGDANWVEGGSLGFARKLERRLMALGGEISIRLHGRAHPRRGRSSGRRTPDRRLRAQGRPCGRRRGRPRDDLRDAGRQVRGRPCSRALRPARTVLPDRSGVPRRRHGPVRRALVPRTVARRG